MFWLNSLVNGGKITNRENLNQVAKHTRRDAGELYKIPEIEPEYLYLFRHYCEIKGQEPLTYLELQAWVSLTGTQLTPAEVDILFVLDATFYEARQKAE